MTDQETRWVHLISALLDESITEDEHAELADALKNERAARRLYRRAVDLDFAIEEEADMGIFENQELAALYLELMQQHALLHLDSAKVTGPVFVNDLEAGPSVARSFSSAPWWLIAAAALFGSIITQQLTTPASPSQSARTEPSETHVEKDQISAMFGALPSCTWDSDLVAPEPGHILSERQYSLRSGAAQIYIGGVEIAVGAESSFRIRNGELYLDRGVIAVRSPEGVSGFQVRTPQHRLEDIGTTFAVQVEQGRARIDVFDGQVNISTQAGELLQELTVGTAATMTGQHATSDRADWGYYMRTFPISTKWHETGPAAARESGLFGQEIQHWRVGDLQPEPREYRWPVNQRISGPTVFDILVAPSYRRPARFPYFELLKDGIVVQRAFKPDDDPYRMYRLWLPAYDPGAAYEIRTFGSAPVNANTSGQIWLKATAMTSPTLSPPPSAKGSNLALNATVTATGSMTNPRGKPEWKPELVTDGRVDHQYWWAGRWPASLQIELAETQSISALHLYLYWSQNRVYTYTVETSLDGQNWQQIIDASQNSLPATRNGEYRVFEPISARYLRLNCLSNTENEAFHVIELQLFGSE